MNSALPANGSRINLIATLRPEVNLARFVDDADRARVERSQDLVRPPDQRSADEGRCNALLRQPIQLLLHPRHVLRARRTTARCMRSASTSGNATTEARRTVQ